MNRLRIDKKRLEKFCKGMKWTYRDLAKASGLSITQSYHLLHGNESRSVAGGATTLGCLISLNVPGLFFLETDSRLQTHLEIRVIEGSEKDGSTV